MDTPPTAITSHAPARDTVIPNLRGEDETELSYLTNLIETQSWILFPSKHPTCVLGRYPTDNTNTDEPPKFCAALYTMGKGGVEGLEYGPKTASSRKEALLRLLGNVEGDVGKMIVRDKRERRDREEMGREKGGRERERGGGN